MIKGSSKEKSEKPKNKIIIERPKVAKKIREEDAIEVHSKYINLDVKLGQIRVIKIDREENHMFIILSNIVQVYYIKNEKPELVHVFGPFETSHIFIDDYCTYLTVLCEDKKQILFFLFDWVYKCEKVEASFHKQKTSRLNLN